MYLEANQVTITDITGITLSLPSVSIRSQSLRISAAPCIVLPRQAEEDEKDSTDEQGRQTADRSLVDDFMGGQKCRHLYIRIYIMFASD